MASLGCFCCITDDSEKEQWILSQAIDRDIKRDRLTYRRTVRILLLGAGESGKSTFLKQMKIIHGQEFSEGDKQEYRMIIYNNILKGMRVLIDARQKLNIPWEDEAHAIDANFVFAFDGSKQLDERVFAEYLEAIQRLWKDSGIRRAFDRRREFQLGDSLPYFMTQMERISALNYTPTRQDILYARKATKGITEYDVHIRGIPFLFVDVGGQRSQRQKWYQCFSGITSILFLAASSEFDQVLMEDRKTNRLQESCDIFETIINNKSFCGVSVILFLNKMDLLEEKIKYVSIADYFPNFEGDPKDIVAVKAFELQLFDSRRRDRSKPLFHHFTTAVDTENIKHVFQDVKDTILHDNLRSLMLQ